MSDLKTRLESALIGQRLERVALFQVNDEPILVEPSKVLAVDGGIEFHLTTGTVCIGWDQETNQFEVGMEALSKMSPELETRKLDHRLFSDIADRPGREIRTIQVVTLSGEDLFGDAFETLLELGIEFAQGPSLQVAAVNWEGVDGGCQDLRYSVDEQLLISSGRSYGIAHPEPEGQ